MKKLNEILSHLKKNPEFRRISSSSTIEQFIEVLPLKLKKGVKFAYVKRQTLFFVLKHPVYKMEFEYNKGLIKSLLKKSQITNVDEISFFVSNRIEKKPQAVKKVESFKERSYGIFENHVKDEKLFKKFENIRNIIKNS